MTSKSVAQTHARLDLIKAIRSGPRTPELLEQALAAMAADTSQVDARVLAKEMGEWGAELVPAATRMLADKQAGNRQKALELFVAAADPGVIPQLEAAKANDRAKKLQREYDYAIRRLTKIASECARERVDPRDPEVDPVARLVELENLPYEQLWGLLGTKQRFWGHHALPWHGFDRHGRRAFTVDGASWAFVVDPQGVVWVETPAGKRSKSVPAAAGVAAKAAHKQLKQQLRELASKRLTRLEEALRVGQTWPGWLWRLLYVDHPLAGASAHALVFEHVQDKRRRCFHVTDGRQLRDLDGNLVEGIDEGSIHVAHPAELEPKALARWRALANERGWDPPLTQLDRPVHRAETDDALDQVVAALPEVYAKTLARRLAKSDFTIDDVDEHGIVAERTRFLGNNCFLALRHGALPARQSEIEREDKTTIRAASLLRALATIAPTKAPARVYSEAVELLHALTR